MSFNTINSKKPLFVTLEIKEFIAFAIGCALVGYSIAFILYNFHIMQVIG